MEKYINFYLDESGKASSEFFVIGGFYIMYDDYDNIQKIQNNIESNILEIEKFINESKIKKNLDSNEKKIIAGSELKWFNLDYEDKKYLFENLKSFGQTNICIISNLKKWIPKYERKKFNLDFIFNMMVNYLIKNFFDKHCGVLKEYEFKIKIFVDDRNLRPKSKKNINGKLQIKKFKNLKEYLDNELLNNDFNKILNIEVCKLDSKEYGFIRYADYIVGLISSMCRFLNNSKNEWDKNIDILFNLINKKNNLECYSTIQNQCEIINKIGKMCLRYEIEKFEKKI